MDLQLAGRVALVTGASAGLGPVIAAVLAAEGCKLALLEQVAAGLPASAEPLLVVEDITGQVIHVDGGARRYSH